MILPSLNSESEANINLGTDDDITQINNSPIFLYVNNQIDLSPLGDDESSIQRAVDSFFASLPNPPNQYKVEQLRDGLKRHIYNQTINEIITYVHVATSGWDQKYAQEIEKIVNRVNKILTSKFRIKPLPNQAIAKIILQYYHVRIVSFTGKRDDRCMLMVYQDNGPDEGIYVDIDLSLRGMVEQIKYTCTDHDVDEVKSILYANATLIMPCEDENIVAVNNGILNYQTKKLSNFDPEICFTQKCRVNYIEAGFSQSPEIVMPDGVVWNFDEWINSLSDDPEIVDLLLKTIGAIIRPNLRIDKMIMFYSQVGCNGKGTLCELMKQLCGVGTYVSIPISDFNDTFGLEPLIGATAVITDENDTNCYSQKMGKLKALITHDEVGINRKNKSIINYKYRGLIVECVNSLPRTGDQTDSLYRRMLFVPFEKTFRGSDRPYIKSDYLHRPEVLEYVLWKVMNIPDYYVLPEPDACKVLLAEYKEFNDPVLQFVEEIFPELVWNKVPQTFIYELYLKWCQKNNPSGKLIGKHGVIDKVKHYIAQNYGDEWVFNEGCVAINKDDNKEPELMIVEYELYSWANPYYRGCDQSKICMSNFKASYKNVFIKK
ncbi:DNA primase family protein [Butyrivibrio sp. AC2005]|uniref:DNA primase family protein n=1 Tax=Butyrivibrio sp. AC2005 TaxID=1280672 RepID=UPI00042496F4|nr:phage/plasmid primase, P4 family [Butyrivibrio sp. AC2005]